MKSKLFRNPDQSIGAYAVTIADAAAFRLVQSCIAIASDLRRDMAEKAQVLSANHPVDIAIVLLGAAEMAWGRTKAYQLVTQIVDLGKAEPFRKATAYRLIRNAFAKLPLTLWGDKLAPRKELIEELERNVILVLEELPRLPSKVEQREEEWREAMLAMRHAPKQKEKIW